MILLSFPRICYKLQPLLNNRISYKIYSQTQIKNIVKFSYSKSTQEKERSLSQNEDIKNKWRTIYRLPVIRWIASFNRLKLYQLGILGLGTPLTFGLELSSYLPPQSTTVVLCLGITGLITLSLASYLTQNCIGFIYINPDENYLRLSYVDFWGKRKDSIYNIDDVLNVTSSKFYQNVQMGGKTSVTYKLIYRFGEISDQNYFNSIFGE